MAQVTETVARGILAGHGYTDNEVRQLAHHWLASHGQAPAWATEPTEQQILEAAEKAGLWPNTVHSWIPAFHRYHKELAKAQPAQAAEPVAWLRNTTDQIADYVADNWPMRKYDLSDIEQRLRMLASAPSGPARVPLTDEQIQDLLLCGNPTDEEMRLIRIGWDEIGRASCRERV